MIGRLDTRPDARKLRQFGWAWFVALGLLWAPILLIRDHPRGAVAVAVLAILGLAAGLTRPRLLRAPFVALSLVTLPIGWAVSAIALAVMYYLVIVPIGVMLRLAGRDPLRRRFDPEAPTYWRERRQPDDADYFRQS